MGMPQPMAGWTVADVLQLPEDGKRYEVVDGELLVTPAPSLLHQEAVQALYGRLKQFVNAHHLGRALVSPADIELDERTLVQPDLFVAPLIDGRRPRSWKDIRSLLLAVEVLSPSTARADRQIKRRRYQRHGVGEYWIVDLDARLVGAVAPGGRAARDPDRSSRMAAQRRWPAA
jgi:Uma2 family endonuclease